MSDLNSDIWTPEEVAEYCRVGVATVRKWAASGVLPAFRVPGSHLLRFHRSDVQRALIAAGNPPTRAPHPAAACESP
jgi:excisionase family DNA binding protein